jgi:hypothetical protein
MSRWSGDNFDQHLGGFHCALDGRARLSISVSSDVACPAVVRPSRLFAFAPSNDSALKRAIASSQVETAARAEGCRLAPDVEKHFADHVLGQRLIADEAQTNRYTRT